MEFITSLILPNHRESEEMHTGIKDDDSWEVLSSSSDEWVVVEDQSLVSWDSCSGPSRVGTCSLSSSFEHIVSAERNRSNVVTKTAAGPSSVASSVLGGDVTRVSLTGAKEPSVPEADLPQCDDKVPQSSVDLPKQHLPAHYNAAVPAPAACLTTEQNYVASTHPSPGDGFSDKSRDCVAGNDKSVSTTEAPQRSPSTIHIKSQLSISASAGQHFDGEEPPNAQKNAVQGQQPSYQLQLSQQPEEAFSRISFAPKTRNRRRKKKSRAYKTRERRRQLVFIDENNEEQTSLKSSFKCYKDLFLGIFLHHYDESAAHGI